MSIPFRANWIDLLSIIGLAFALYVLYSLLNDAVWSIFEGLSLFQAIPAIGIGIGALSSAGICLEYVVRSFVNSPCVSKWDAVLAANKTILAKYIPGKIWYAMGMAESLVHAGVPRRHAWSIVMAFQALIIVVALMLGIVAVLELGAGAEAVRYFPSEMSPWSIVAIAGMVLVPIVVVAFARRMLWRRLSPMIEIRALAGAALVACAFWILHGLSTWLFLSALVDGWMPAGTIFVVPGIYALGFLVLVVPGGVGVRELLFVEYFVILGMTSGESAALALAARIGALLVEVVMWLLLRVVQCRCTERDGEPT